MTFGHYPDISLAEARVEFQGLKSVRKAGRCPKAERDHKRRQEEEERQEESRKLLTTKFTVTTMIDRYLEEYIEDRYIEGRKIPGARNKKAQRECRRTLEADAVRVLGSHPAVEVTRRDIVDLIGSIIQRGSEVQAGNVLRELVASYEYSIGMERFPDEFSNPALQAKERLKRTKVRLSSKARGRFLNDAELVKLLSWLPGSGFSTTQKNVMRLTLWTGLRTGTVCRVEWSEVDLVKGTLFVPDSKSKTGVGQSVQLPRQAVNFLEQLKLSTETYLFPSTRTGKPIQQKSLSETKWQLKNPEKITNRRRYTEGQVWLDTIDDWAPHDLRRTVRTGLARLGCPGDVAEAIVGHSKRGIEGTYNLYEYEAECKVWLQKWADHLDSLMP